METFISCNVCREIYDENTRCPRMLICGHTFCTFCLKKFLLEICPKCRRLFGQVNPESLTINYVIKKLAEMYRKTLCSPEEIHNELIAITENRKTKYGQLSVVGEKVLITKMQDTPPTSPAYCLTVDQYIRANKIQGRTWAQKIYLQFVSDKALIGDVIIRLNLSISEAAKYVLQTCLLGCQGASFKEAQVQSTEAFVYTTSPLFRVPPEVNIKKLLHSSKRLDHHKGTFCVGVRKTNGIPYFSLYLLDDKSILFDDLIPTGKVINETNVVSLVRQGLTNGQNIRIIDSGWIVG